MQVTKTLFDEISYNFSKKLISRESKSIDNFLEYIYVIYRPGVRPRAVLQTSGTVFPHTDLPAGK